MRSVVTMGTYFYNAEDEVHFQAGKRQEVSLSQQLPISPTKASVKPLVLAATFAPLELIPLQCLIQTD